MGTFITEVIEVTELFKPKPLCYPYPNPVVYFPYPNHTGAVQRRSSTPVTGTLQQSCCFWELLLIDLLIYKSFFIYRLFWYEGVLMISENDRKCGIL